MKILVTGGAGYIGSHTCVQLLQAGHEVHLIDAFSNSYPGALAGVEKITGKSAILHEIDLRDEAAVDHCFDAFCPDVVIHFAGLKVVADSIQKPLEYYSWNISSTTNLLRVMKNHDVNRLIFSSSASVYGDTVIPPIQESSALAPINPYGHSKMMLEQVLQDIVLANHQFHCVCLRYFNPVGAHCSGLIGENAKRVLGNLFPYIADAAIGKERYISVFGNDYSTPDGTGVRDYIHVMDLAAGHLAALDFVDATSGCSVINLGTGRGYSVMEVIKTFEEACGHTIPIKLLPRRAGDVAQSYADCTKANNLLHWSATRDLETMCQDAWRWRCCLAKGCH